MMARYIGQLKDEENLVYPVTTVEALVESEEVVLSEPVSPDLRVLTDVNGEAFYPVGTLTNIDTTDADAFINDIGLLTNEILPLSVANGGTGATSFTAGRYIIGSGTYALRERTPAEVAEDIGQYIKTDVSGLLPKPTLLWSNASPTSSFAAQTVSLDLSEYGYIDIECRHTTSKDEYVVVRIPKGQSYYNYFVSELDDTSSYNPHFRSRKITTSDSGVTFGGGYNKSAGATYAQTGNNMCVPIRIYGVKL